MRSRRSPQGRNTGSPTLSDRGQGRGRVEIVGLTWRPFGRREPVLRDITLTFDEFREARFAPPPLLKRMVLAGQLGKKSGRGFYQY